MLIHPGIMVRFSKRPTSYIYAQSVKPSDASYPLNAVHPYFSSTVSIPHRSSTDTEDKDVKRKLFHHDTTGEEVLSTVTGPPHHFVCAIPDSCRISESSY